MASRAAASLIRDVALADLARVVLEVDAGAAGSTAARRRARGARWRRRRRRGSRRASAAGWRSRRTRVCCWSPWPRRYWLPMGTPSCYARVGSRAHVAADHRLHRHRPPDVVPRDASPTPSWSTSSTSCRSRSWSTTSRYAAGGCAANICFGLGNLGPRPGARRGGRRGLRRLPRLARAAPRRLRLACTSPRPATPRASSAPTTRPMAQIASFYAGAMSEAREIELKPIADRVGRAGVRPDRPRRPRGDAPPHRRVPPARLPVRRRPLAAAGLRRRRPDPRR